MADYIGITEAQSNPFAPLTSELVKQLRDNPLAIAEGAEDAPLISGALTKIISQQEIGAFIFARGPSTTAYGDVVAGSSLTYAGALSSASASGSTQTSGGADGLGLSSVSFNAGAGGSPSGSWVCLGRIQASFSAGGTSPTSASGTAATLWQRVA